MNTAIVNFNGGEFSPKIDCRSDTEKYTGGCRQSDNMIPLVFGGSERRPGTELIKNTNIYNLILSKIVGYENVVVCNDEDVATSGFDALLSQIVCYEFDVVCYENNIVSDGNMAFTTRAVCYENDLVFGNNNVVYI